jgi:hypothetical protein
MGCQHLALAILVSFGVSCVSLSSTLAEPPSLANPKSVAGQPILSVPVDPYMTADQEQRILDLLNKPASGINWRSTTVEELADQISPIVPTFVNTRALEDEGLTRDMPLTIRGQGELEKLPLGANLMHSLDENDLTFRISSGKLIITTKTDAESEDNLATRVYDVTPIVIIRNIGRQSSTDFNTLMQSIQTIIEPNGWEALGGPSTIFPSTVRDRALLTISTTTVVHLQVQSYLSHLNAGPDTNADQDLKRSEPDWPYGKNQMYYNGMGGMGGGMGGMMNIKP